VLFMLLAGLVLLALKFITVSRARNFILCQVAGFCALVLVPALWTYVAEVTWTLGTLYPFWRSSECWLFALESAVVGAFFFVAARLHLSIWWSIAVLSIHYSIWTGVIVPWTLP